MDVWEYWKEDNGKIRERYHLSMERINRMLAEETTKQPFRDYFIRTAELIGLIGQTVELVSSGRFAAMNLQERKELNTALYQDIFPGNYDMSYGNPAYAAAKLGQDFGPLLSFLYAQIRAQIRGAYEGRLLFITAANEAFIEIYNLFEQGEPQAKAVKDVLYWFVSDYADESIRFMLWEKFSPEWTFAADIIMNADLSKPDYLYEFGEYISESDLALSQYMAGLSPQTIRLMADTFVEGYRKGFAVMGVDLSAKKTVLIRYELGFERMVREAAAGFAALNLKPLFYRVPTCALNRNPNRRVGWYASSPNKQYDYDHRYDNALFMGNAIKERQLEAMQSALADLREEASWYAGPAVIETFGEAGFEPVNKKENFVLSDHQQEVARIFAGESRQLMNQYIPEEEISFTIIAFPRPEIGRDFDQIFHETIKINTLDSAKYHHIQQQLIDALDQAEAAVITGANGNETNLSVSLRELAQPDRETRFENCLADVNIPLGEVFTSPKLKGTNGLLHVKSVYIGEFQFKNLRMWFKDGMVTDYSCENLDREEENKALVKQVILKNHESLPMGEFAIGTNTAAYAMGKKYGIVDRLPILIVEKMGPHFAVGDTCYSWSEESRLYNPDGKEIVAKDNEISILRKEDVSKAYFNCHTDITIPYSELGDIMAVNKDGTRTGLIQGGRFVLPGTEELNVPLELNIPLELNVPLELNIPLE